MFGGSGGRHPQQKLPLCCPGPRNDSLAHGPFRVQLYKLTLASIVRNLKEDFARHSRIRSLQRKYLRYSHNAENTSILDHPSHRGYQRRPVSHVQSKRRKSDRPMETLRKKWGRVWGGLVHGNISRRKCSSIYRVVP